MLRCTGYLNPRRVLLAGTLAALLGGGSPGVVAAAERPFILWTKEDAAAIRKKVETRPWARAAYQKLAEDPDRHQRSIAGLFRYTVMGDQTVVEPGTTRYVAATPKLEPVPRKPDPGPNEVGGTSIVAARRCPRTAFVALHEPFKAASPRITEFRCIEQKEDSLAVAVMGRPGSGVDDRVILRYGDDVEKPITLAGDGESFTFADHAHVRIGKDAVEVWGDLRAMKVRVKGRPRLVVNGKERNATVASGLLTHVN